MNRKEIILAGGTLAALTVACLPILAVGQCKLIFGDRCTGTPLPDAGVYRDCADLTEADLFGGCELCLSLEGEPQMLCQGDLRLGR